MKFLKFMFTSRASFILFALVAFAFTVLYLAWNQRHAALPPAQQQHAVRSR